MSVPGLRHGLSESGRSNEIGQSSGRTAESNVREMITFVYVDLCYRLASRRVDWISINVDC